MPLNPTINDSSINELNDLNQESDDLRVRFNQGFKEIQDILAKTLALADQKNKIEINIKSLEKEFGELLAQIIEAKESGISELTPEQNQKFVYIKCQLDSFSKQLNTTLKEIEENIELTRNKLNSRQTLFNEYIETKRKAGLKVHEIINSATQSALNIVESHGQYLEQLLNSTNIQVLQEQNDTGLLNEPVRSFINSQHSNPALQPQLSTTPLESNGADNSSYGGLKPGFFQ